MKEDRKQLFVGGDLSGIQNYLYNISSKMAAVSLKGRSYYLKQHMDDVCSSVKQAAEEGGASYTDIIYCSGGKFYMLTEYSEDVIKKIDQCVKQIKKDLWEKHFGQLGINISYVPFQENEDGTVDVDGMIHQKPGCLWKRVNAEFSRQKNQKFKDVLLSDFKNFFEPIPIGGHPKVCAVTGIESATCVGIDLDKGDSMFVLPSVYQQIQLGKELRDQQHFRTFEEYAGNTDIGILRMDLDNLGKRFIDGFNSIKEYKAFSQRLVEFFDENVETIRQDKAFNNYLNLIYSGGDDLFAIGRWDKIIDFAEKIHQEIVSHFMQDGISISGGIAVVSPKYPIAKAAELAGKAEEAAKAFNDGKKNALTFLGRTVSWDEEFDYVKNYKQQFVSLISEYSLSKSILHKLMLYSSIADQNKIKKSEGKPEDFSYVWHISYYLTRYINRYKTNKVVCDFCRQLRDVDLNYRQGRHLELIALAARWAELMLKDDIINN